MSILLKIILGIFLLVIIISIIYTIVIIFFASKVVDNELESQKESFEDSAEILNQLEKKLNILESKMIAMKEPINSDKKKYDKQIYTVSTNHYYTPSEMYELSKFSL